MEDLSQKVRDILTRAFPGADVMVARVSPDARWEGEIVWAGFDGVDHFDRQRRLREVLRQALTADERSGLSIILAFTPTEDAAMKEEAGPIY